MAVDSHQTAYSERSNVCQSVILTYKPGHPQGSLIACDAGAPDDNLDMAISIKINTVNST